MFWENFLNIFILEQSTMKDDRKLRALRNFFYKYARYGHEDGTKACITARILRDIKYLRNQLTGRYSRTTKRELYDCEVALRHIVELHLSDSALTEMAEAGFKKYFESWQTEGRNTPVKPNRARDNKCHNTYLYSGSSTRVRFPSLKRGRSTWKRFYTMFPRIAEEDNWDGKTSNRYKG